MLSYRTEPQIFKTRFKDWNDVLDVDYTRTPEMQEKRKMEVVCLSVCMSVSPSVLLSVCLVRSLAHFLVPLFLENEPWNTAREEGSQGMEVVALCQHGTIA